MHYLFVYATTHAKYNLNQRSLYKVKQKAVALSAHMQNVIKAGATMFSEQTDKKGLLFSFDELTLDSNSSTLT